MINQEEATIDDLQQVVAEFAATRDWVRFHNPRQLAAAIAIEAAELLEIFQWRSDESCRQENLDDATVSAIRSELADVVIYALNMANSVGLRVGAAVQAKLAENALRFPIERARDDA